MKRAGLSGEVRAEVRRDSNSLSHLSVINVSLRIIGSEGFEDWTGPFFGNPEGGGDLVGRTDPFGSPRPVKWGISVPLLLLSSALLRISLCTKLKEPTS